MLFDLLGFLKVVLCLYGCLITYLRISFLVFVLTKFEEGFVLLVLLTTLLYI